MLPVLRHRSLQFIFLQSSLTELMHFYIQGVPTAIIKSDSLPALRGRSFIIHLHQSRVKPYGTFIFIINVFLGLLSFQMLPVLRDWSFFNCIFIQSSLTGLSFMLDDANLTGLVFLIHPSIGCLASLTE